MLHADWQFQPFALCMHVHTSVFTEDLFCALGTHHNHVVPVTPFIVIWFVVLSGALQQTHFSVWPLGPGRLTVQTRRHLYYQCLHFIDPVGMCLIIRLFLFVEQQLRWDTEHSSVSSVKWKAQSKKHQQSTFYRPTRFVCNSGVLPSRSDIHIVCVPQPLKCFGCLAATKVTTLIATLIHGPGVTTLITESQPGPRCLFMFAFQGFPGVKNNWCSYLHSEAGCRCVFVPSLLCVCPCPSLQMIFEKENNWSLADRDKWGRVVLILLWRMLMVRSSTDRNLVVIGRFFFFLVFRSQSTFDSNIEQCVWVNHVQVMSVNK